MTVALSALALLAGAVAIASRPRKGALHWTAKPLATALILALALTGGGESSTYRSWIALGLLLSLLGDVLLMLPRERFVAGLASFLAAHLAYFAAFSSVAAFRLDPLALLPFLVAGVALLRALWPGLGSLKPAVALYAVAIAAMGWRALAQWLALDTDWALRAFAGATLFLVSDSLLALERFRTPFPLAGPAILATYWSGQYLIALSTHP